MHTHSWLHTLIRHMATKKAGCGCGAVGGWRGGCSKGIPTGEALNTTSPSPSNTLYIIKTCLEALEGRGKIIKSCV